MKDAFFDTEKKNIEQYDLVFSCVGPANCYDLAEDYKRAKTLISCENDISTVKGLKELSGNRNIYFGIPDVITSNTAPPELLKQDPLMTVTEKGVLVLEKVVDTERRHPEVTYLCDVEDPVVRGNVFEIIDHTVD